MSAIGDFFASKDAIAHRPPKRLGYRDSAIEDLIPDEGQVRHTSFTSAKENAHNDAAALR